jgi:hypothetical protein
MKHQRVMGWLAWWHGVKVQVVRFLLYCYTALGPFPDCCRRPGKIELTELISAICGQFLQTKSIVAAPLFHYHLLFATVFAKWIVLFFYKSFCLSISLQFLTLICRCFSKGQASFAGTSATYKTDICECSCKWFDCHCNSQ